eukprot:SAG31_NODE_26418_length_442_cov_1.982507_1_plen_102_part_10
MHARIRRISDPDTIPFDDPPPGHAHGAGGVRVGSSSQQVQRRRRVHISLQPIHRVSNHERWWYVAATRFLTWAARRRGWWACRSAVQISFRLQTFRLPAGAA